MQHLANFFRALGEEGRLKILKFLIEGEKCVCEIIEEMDLSQAAISHHLRVLRKAGLIKVRREGRWGFYSLDVKGFSGLENILDKELFKPVFGGSEESNHSSLVCPEK